MLSGAVHKQRATSPAAPASNATAANRLSPGFPAPGAFLRRVYVTPVPGIMSPILSRQFSKAMPAFQERHRPRKTDNSVLAPLPPIPATLAPVFPQNGEAHHISCPQSPSPRSYHKRTLCALQSHSTLARCFLPPVPPSRNQRYPRARIRSGLDQTAVRPYAEHRRLHPRQHAQRLCLQSPRTRLLRL